MFVPRDARILSRIAAAGYGTADLVHRFEMPETGPDKKAVRNRLAILHGMGLLAKASQLVVRVQDGQPARVWYLTKKGAEVLAVETGEEKWLCCVPPTPNPATLRHSILAGEFRVTMELAAEKVPGVSILHYTHEWSPLDVHAKSTHERFKLFQLLREKPRLVCAPDGGFMIEVAGRRKVFFLEIDRETSSLNAIAASKTPGYAEMLKQQTHRKLFPDTTLDVFSVLHVSLTAKRRDAIVKAIAPKEGSELWRFMAWDEITHTQENSLTGMFITDLIVTQSTPKNLLTSKLVYDCRKDPEKQKPQPYALVTLPEGAK